jgi:hypothetical protein
MVAESIKVFLNGQFWLDPEIFGPDQVAFTRGMDVKHVKHRSCKRETKRNVVADSDKHILVAFDDHTVGLLLRTDGSGLLPAAFATCSPWIVGYQVPKKLHFCFFRNG